MIPQFLRHKNWGALAGALTLLWYVPLGLVAGIYALVNADTGGIKEGTAASHTFGLLAVIPLGIALLIGCIFLLYFLGYLFKCWWTGQSVG